MTLTAPRVIDYITYPDPTFADWAEGALVWLPEKGMGYLPVQGEPYSDEYYDKYVAYSKTALGRRLTVSRIEMVQRNAFPIHKWIGLSNKIPTLTIMDIGIGCGDFIERANETWTDRPVVGFDVNRTAIEWLTDRGLYRNPYVGLDGIDIATFWDSLEHIADAHRILENVTGWVFCSLPIVPGDGPPPANWKHLRRDEHTWYWTRDGLINWMAAQGFLCVEHNTAESIAGREDIGSFAFRRVA